MPLKLVRHAGPDEPPRLPGGGRVLRVGLIISMADQALASTERQFATLLESACGSRPIELHLSSLPEIPRAPATRARMQGTYWPIDELLALHPDTLIVTGMEPGAGSLREEAYWDRFAALVDWAEAHTATSIWSCLAAHAVAEHLHGIRRRRLSRKCFGVFEHTPQRSHALLEGVPLPLRMPHSRWNELPIPALVSAGFEVLSAAPECGADLFVHSARSLLVCFQGHPEYESTTLLKEYRRDVGRYLRGEQVEYPERPVGYFDPLQSAQLAGFETLAFGRRSPELIERFPHVDMAQPSPWFAAAQRIFANWLHVLADSNG